MKRVLFISPTHMDLYKDILSEMERQCYIVDFLPEKTFKYDPYNKREESVLIKKGWKQKQFEAELEQYWTNILNSEKYNNCYDYLFVLDGQSIRKVVFDILEARNPNLRSVNYLFDTTTGVYEFQHNFPFFNSVYSFDKKEVSVYGLKHLPIYWVEDEHVTEDIDLFGLGRYSRPRYDLFRTLHQIVKGNGFSILLKLNMDKISNIHFYRIKYAIREALNLIYDRPSPDAYLSEYCTTENISPSQFRSLICRSKCIVDTSAAHQDGLTARFMWALGLGRKIITTNESVKTYSFYSPHQIFVVKNSSEVILKKEEILSFVNEPFIMEPEIKSVVEQYRLDNWVRTILQEE